MQADTPPEGMTNGVAGPRSHLRPAVFLHIQKTAGTSIQRMAYDLYGAGNVISHGDYEQLKIPGCAQKAFASGHFGFEFARRLMPGRYSFTFLRDPQQRIVSLYHYFRGATEVETELFNSARIYDLPDFLRFCIEKGYLLHVRDHQVFQIAYGFGSRYVLGRTLTAAQLDPAHMLEVAKRNLFAFDHVGLVETFDSDVRAVFRALGAAHVTVERSNVSKRSGADIPRAAIPLLEDLTRHDQPFYDYAVSVRDSINDAAPPLGSADMPLRARIKQAVSRIVPLRPAPVVEPVMIQPLRERIFITGTGRAGMSFLVQLLTALGLDTGFGDGAAAPAGTTGLAAGFDDRIRAGFDHDPFGYDNPRIVKSGLLCDRLDDVLDAGIRIAHLLIPVRDLRQAADSRRRVQATSAAPTLRTPVPGGLWGTANPAEQEAVLAEKFLKLVEAAARRGVPMTFLSFPRMVRDAAYAHASLQHLFPEVTRDAFDRAFQRTARPDWVHEAAGAGAMPAFVPNPVT